MQGATEPMSGFVTVRSQTSANSSARATHTHTHTHRDAVVFALQRFVIHSVQSAIPGQVLGPGTSVLIWDRSGSRISFVCSVTGRAVPLSGCTLSAGVLGYSDGRSPRKARAHARADAHQHQQ